MIRIRLDRKGKRNDPFYRIVAIEKGRKRSGRALDIVGHWHPAKDQLKVDKKKIDEWVKKGAKISIGVAKLLK